MLKRTFSVIMITLLFLSVMLLAFNVQPVKGDAETVYINADGSITPSGAPIATSDNITYILTGNISYPTYGGIVVERSNIIISGNGYSEQGGQGGNGIGLTNTNNVTIENTDIQDFSHGINLLSSSNDLIGGNSISNDSCGIGLYSSFNNSIIGNIITANGEEGIWFYSSFNNSLSGNNITANNMGIGLSFSFNNTISGNFVAADVNEGIYLSYSFNNNIADNSVTNNFWGVYLDSSAHNSISENNIINSSDGVYLYHSDFNNVSGDNIANNYRGIYLERSSKNSMSENNVTSSTMANIYLYYSYYNTIVENNLVTTVGYDIILQSSTGSIMSGNTLSRGGLVVIDSYQDSVQNNTVDGKPLVYLEDVANYNVSEAGQVVLVSCDNIKVESLNLSTARVSIELWETNDSFISWNNVANVYVGILVVNSSSDNIYGNNITNSDYGIVILFSSGNEVYHNNIISNVIQVLSYGSTNVWDDGYPSGGNYWSDFGGTDAYSGAYQNISGSDGIGDAPYIIDSNNEDHYPLMQPWITSSHDVAVIAVATNITWIYQGFSVDINVTVLNKGEFNQNVTATLYYNITAGEMIDTQNMTIPAGENSTLSFVWNTRGVPYNRSYTLKAVATISEVDNTPADNTLPGGPITVRILGDINGDGKVDGRDIVIAAKAFGTRPRDPRWNPDADVNQDGRVDGRDITLIARNFGK